MVSVPYRWRICALLFFATTINYIDRQVLGVLAPYLQPIIGWNEIQYGYIVASFQAAYALGLLAVGGVIDRLGTRIGYAIAISIWSLAAMSHALVHSVLGFATARFILGFGEAGNFPSAIKTVAEWFPRRERALATGIFNSGSNIGAIVAPLTVPWITVRLGWQWAFLFTGFFSAAWLIAWLTIYRPALRAESDPEESSVKIPWAGLLVYRQTWAFAAGKFITDPVWWFFLIWLPDFFKKTRHLDIKNSWVHLVSIYTIITVLSIIGGWVTGWLTGRGWSITRARKSGMFVFALCVVPIAMATRVSDWTAVFLIGLAGAAHQAWSANLFTTVSDMFPKRAVATLTGVGSTAGSVGGMCFPILTGMLLDHFANGYAIIFGLCSVAYLLAFLINHLLAPKFDPVVLDEG